MPKARDLAGLAALGFLGYKLSQRGKGKDEDSTPTRAARPDSTETREDKDDDKGYKKDVLKAITATKEAPNYKADNQGVIPPKSSGKSAAAKQAPEAAPAAKDEATVTPSSRTTPGGGEKRVEGRKPMPSLKAVEQKAAARQTSMATDAMKNASRSAARRANLSPIDQIPGQDRSGPTGGERVSGTEFSRNLSNTAAALTPLTGGVGKIGAEMATSGRAQRAYNAAQAERRAAEGMSPAEAIAAKQAAVQAARDAKTLNPNAWLAGPKGMAENFRKGGAVKMTASRRGDGIASRGKTRGKIC